MQRTEVPNDTRTLPFLTASLAALLIGAIALFLDVSQSNLLAIVLIVLSGLFAVVGIGTRVKHEKRVREFLAELRQSKPRRKLDHNVSR